VVKIFSICTLHNRNITVTEAVYIIMEYSSCLFCNEFDLLRRKMSTVQVPGVLWDEAYQVLDGPVRHHAQSHYSSILQDIRGSRGIFFYLSKKLQWRTALNAVDLTIYPKKTATATLNKKKHRESTNLENLWKCRINDKAGPTTSQKITNKIPPYRFSSGVANPDSVEFVVFWSNPDPIGN
jgi:hypothetical protein